MIPYNKKNSHRSGSIGFTLRPIGLIVIRCRNLTCAKIGKIFGISKFIRNFTAKFNEILLLWSEYLVLTLVLIASVGPL
jgi:hypothetical protein